MGMPLAALLAPVTMTQWSIVRNSPHAAQLRLQCWVRRGAREEVLGP